MTALWHIFLPFLLWPWFLRAIYPVHDKKPSFFLSVLHIVCIVSWMSYYITDILFNFMLLVLSGTITQREKTSLCHRSSVKSCLILTCVITESFSICCLSRHDLCLLTLNTRCSLCSSFYFLVNAEHRKWVISSEENLQLMFWQFLTMKL